MSERSLPSAVKLCLLLSIPIGGIALLQFCAMQPQLTSTDAPPLDEGVEPIQSAPPRAKAPTSRPSTGLDKVQKAGKIRLHAELWAIISVDGASSKRRVKTFDYSVTVAISRADQVGLFLKEHWKWVLMGPLVATGKWAWGKRKKKES